jgi:hypothetical protein
VILVAAVAVSTLIGLLRGGRLIRLADLQIRWPGLALVAVALQVPLVYNLLHDRVVLGVSVAQLLLGVAWLLVIGLVWVNWRLPGMPLVGLGIGCNLLVMTLNGGWMPITPEALSQLGRLAWVESGGHAAKIPGSKSVMLPRAETRLWWLSDIFVLAPPFPVPAAFSVGDVLIALGIFWLLQQVLLGRVNRADPPRVTG